jgi:hypothetical protein
MHNNNSGAFLPFYFISRDDLSASLLGTKGVSFSLVIRNVPFCDKPLRSRCGEVHMGEASCKENVIL